jgi:predicted phosphodiesterase
MKIAIISDIHEDLKSLEQALRKIDSLHCNEIICLGDISGYSSPYHAYIKTRNAHECLNLIKSNCKTVILGNHDIHAATIIPQNCAFFHFPENWYQMNYQERKKLSDNTLWLHDHQDIDPLYSDEDTTYLRSLSESAIYTDSKSNMLFSHYAFPNISGIKKDFYTYRFEFQQHFKFMKTKECTISFIAHSHPNWLYSVTKDSLKQHSFNDSVVLNETICIGIPPITSPQNKNGFCVFDTNQRVFYAIKL